MTNLLKKEMQKKLIFRQHGWKRLGSLPSVLLFGRKRERRSGIQVKDK